MYLGYGYGYGYGYGGMYLLPLLLAMAFSLIASIKVKSTYRKYDQIPTSAGLTAEMVVSRLLRNAGISGISLLRGQGELTDNYNPSDQSLTLSESTYGHSSIAAIGVAAHETGHAMQHEDGYAPMRLRSLMVPAVNIGSHLGLILCIAGSFFNTGTSMSLVDIGILLYSLTFLFTVVTLPVELNASRRALAGLRDTNLYTDEELKGARKVLTAAAMTYVASMFAALINLLRIMAIFGNRRGRR